MQRYPNYMPCRERGQYSPYNSPVRREPRRPSFLAHLPLPADPLCAKEDRILPPPLVNEVHYHHQSRFVVFLLERIVAEQVSLQHLLGYDFRDEDTGFLGTQAWLIDASYHVQRDIEEIGCEGRWICPRIAQRGSSKRVTAC